MTHNDLDTLKASYEQGLIVPLIRTLHCSVDPLLLYRLAGDHTPRALLESARAGGVLGRYSYVAWDPFVTVTSRGREVSVSNAKDCIAAEQGPLTYHTHPFTVLRQLFHIHRGHREQSYPHFVGGAIGYCGYGLAQVLQEVPLRPHPLLPDLYFFFPRKVIAYHHESCTVNLIVNLIPEQETSFDAAYAQAVTAVETVEEQLVKQAMPEPGEVVIHSLQAAMHYEYFSHMIQRAQEYIRAGDIYQANLSQQFQFSCAGDASALYDALRHINPSPFAALLDLGEVQVVSSSPERLVSLRGRACETRPIAGTRPQGATQTEVNALSHELLLNEKERAEHIMLVDLERNDLGRVCEYDSVQVNEFMTIEHYSHVMHIVSNVIGTLRQDQDQFDLIAAMFPGGTITGCPKRRCMEIIEELEPSPRGIYTGSIGYLDWNGDLDLNIVIRTLVLQSGSGSLHVGAGIVHDSVPEREYEETLHKAQALFEALGRMRETDTTPLLRV